MSAEHAIAAFMELCERVGLSWEIAKAVKTACDNGRADIYAEKFAQLVENSSRIQRLREQLEEWAAWQGR